MFIHLFVCLFVCFRDHYVTTVAWGADKKVSVTWLNRDQDKSIMQICELGNVWFCAEVSLLVEENS